MPTLQLNLRQRERINARTWKPLTPNFIVYSIFSAVYSRTYTLVNINYNDPLEHNDPIPFGFTFSPAPDPPLVPIQQDSGINAIVPIGEDPTGQIVIPNIPQIVSQPPIIPPSSSPLTTQQQQNSLYNIQFINILVGIVSKQVSLTPKIVRRVTILADSANTGVIWVSSSKNTPVGTTFPLAAGAAKDFGDANSDKGVDLSQLFLTGTNVNDLVRIETET